MPANKKITKDIQEIVEEHKQIIKEEVEMAEVIEEEILEFRGKPVEIDEGVIKLFFKEIEGEEYFLVHRYGDGSYLTCLMYPDGTTTTDISSGKPLSVLNTIFENKFIEDNTKMNALGTEEEIKKMLREAGQFIKNHQQEIFPPKRAFKRSKKEQALLKAYEKIKARYTVIVDEEEENLYVYNRREGFYKELKEKAFARLLKQVTGEEYFDDEVRKVMGLFSIERRESEDYIAFKNCLLNLDTLTTRSFTPEIFVKFQVPYNWNPEAHSQFFETKIKEILDEDEKFNTYIQALGYCFTKNNPHSKLFLFIGNGSNGKSLLMDLIGKIFNEAAAGVELQKFDQEFGLQPLIGARVNILGDLPKRKIEETGQIKQITGGDILTINRKFKEPWTGIVGCKIIGSGNDLPEINDDSFAFWRRIILIRLDKRFVGNNKDPKLTEKLLQDTEGMEWLIYTAINGYKQIASVGWSEDSTKEIRMEYIKESKPAQYAAENVFEITDARDDFLTNEEVIEEIDRYIVLKDLSSRELRKNDYYNSVRNMGAEDAQFRDRTRGFRYMKIKEYGDE